ncbi:nuclease-like protein [Salsuginibacillus halophilus]|uniref:Nuclease-like protein n=1 Tax=Salsuginibacillus halophilus TaxID=517424 RepID=A0A2P8HQC4_9BACI|nr:nuclease-related domain-containing protein [Salsuginibacillus halophilus]PSL48421.1 nuclease-like protein [Salsuginibacillus halophilus]
MIIKPLKKTAPLLQLEALKHRLPADHPAYPGLMTAYHKRHAGHRGEQSLNFIFNRFFSEFRIFQDIRLPVSPDRFFQLDAILLTPHRLFLLEVKHLKGSIDIPSRYGLMTRTLPETVEQFTNPLVQLHNTSELLWVWAAERGLPELPVHHIAVFTHRDSVLWRPADCLLLRPEELWRVTKELTAADPETTGKEKALQSWQSALLASHKPAPLPKLSSWQLTLQNLRPGVRCGTCSDFTMHWLHKRWRCTRCGRIELYAHRAALEDFFNLTSDPFTNGEVRDFLQLNSRHTTRRFLQDVGCRQLTKPHSHLYIPPGC